MTRALMRGLQHATCNDRRKAQVLQYNHPMPRRAILACTGVLLLWCGCSPYGGGAFTCEIDSECGAGGKCSDGFCSFPDTSCDSGFRYGELSGPLSSQCVGATQTVDAGDDVDTMSGFCYGTGLLTACFDAVPTGTQMLGGNDTINTDSDPLCATTSNAVPACVIAAESITVANGFFGATGTKPLVLVATQTITVNAGSTLTVASLRQFNFVGAGSDMAGCDTGTAPTGNSGGAGGSLGGAGGNGAAVGTAGIAGAALGAAAFRGGCSGQIGGDSGAPTGGAAGRGGGAMYLIANTSITVGGNVSANGGGGGGGANADSAGGGGGGSGGFLVFDTPSLMVTGLVLANGGGGGEGSGAQSTGVPGQDASTATMAAAGGAGGTSFGTDGGNGSVGATLTGGNGAANCTGTCTTPTSGGGGGGGAGIIKLYRAASVAGGGGVSPAPQ
jgi:hypothetical protein